MERFAGNVEDAMRRSISVSLNASAGSAGLFCSSLRLTHVAHGTAYFCRHKCLNRKSLDCNHSFQKCVSFQLCIWRNLQLISGLHLALLSLFVAANVSLVPCFGSGTFISNSLCKAFALRMSDCGTSYFFVRSAIPLNALNTSSFHFPIFLESRKFLPLAALI